MKTLNLTEEELVILIRMIRELHDARQLHKNAELTDDERFLFDYAQAQAGYTCAWSKKLLERVFGDKLNSD